MRSKYKVCFRIRESKAQARQFLLDPLSGSCDLCRGGLEISIILYRFHAHDLGSQVHGIGVKGEFYIIQIVYQLLITDTEADTHSRHGSGFGKSLYYQKILIFFKQGQCTCASKVHISLIHDHYHVRIGL